MAGAALGAGAGVLTTGAAAFATTGSALALIESCGAGLADD